MAQQVVLVADLVKAVELLALVDLQHSVDPLDFAATALGGAAIYAASVLS